MIKSLSTPQIMINKLTASIFYKKIFYRICIAAIATSINCYADISNTPNSQNLNTIYQNQSTTTTLIDAEEKLQAAQEKYRRAEMRLEAIQKKRASGNRSSSKKTREIGAWAN